MHAAISSRQGVTPVLQMSVFLLGFFCVNNVPGPRSVGRGYTRARVISVLVRLERSADRIPAVEIDELRVPVRNRRPPYVTRAAWRGMCSSSVQDRRRTVVPRQATGSQLSRPDGAASHIAGPLGRALMSRLLELGWLARDPHTTRRTSHLDDDRRRRQARAANLRRRRARARDRRVRGR